MVSGANSTETVTSVQIVWGITAVSDCAAYAMAAFLENAKISGVITSSSSVKKTVKAIADATMMPILRSVIFPEKRFPSHPKNRANKL